MRALATLAVAFYLLSSQTIHAEPPIWTGVYWGIQAGVSHTTGSMSEHQDTSNDYRYWDLFSNISNATHTSSSSDALLRGSAWSGGEIDLMVGANSAFGKSWLIGLQVDAGLAQMRTPINGSSHQNNDASTYTSTISADLSMEWLRRFSCSIWLSRDGQYPFLCPGRMDSSRVFVGPTSHIARSRLCSNGRSRT